MYLAPPRGASHLDCGGIAFHRSDLRAGGSSRGAPVRLRVRSKAAFSGIEKSNQGTQGDLNEENMCVAPHGRWVSSVLGMSAFEKVMDE